MAVSTAIMGLSELAQFLAASGTYSSVAEAMAALNIVIIDAGAAEIAAGTAIAVQGGAGTAVVGTVGQTALEIAAQAQLAATGSNVTTASIGLLSGQGVTTAAVLGVDLGIVAAAAAPLLGVGLGVTLYESNPELWTQISQKLLPFCYPGTTCIPTWADIANSVWEVSVSKKVIDALKELFEEEGIDPEKAIGYTTYHEDGNTYDVAQVTQGQVIGKLLDGTTWRDIVAPRTTRCIVTRPISGTTIFNLEQGSSIQYSYPDEKVVPYIPISDGVKWNFQGEGTYHSGDMPEGTTKWDGDVPQEIPETKPAVIGDGEGGTTTQPMVPISIPQEIPDTWKPGEPAPSPDPETQPDPTKTTQPETQVQPYVMPLPIPWETTLPNPDEETETSPELDPTTPRPPTQIITEPPIDLGPEPIGLSPVPPMPTTDLPFASNVGLITVYHPTAAQLYDFERWLWVTYADATIDKIWNNPFDGVICLFELYCTPTDVGNRNIHCGFLDSGISSAVISRYTYIDCGTLGIPEYYGNYLDYSPYSKAHIYLPFIGIQELNVDDIVGHAVNVMYRIDEYNGSCIAMITVAKVTTVNGQSVQYSNTMYQFSGNCAVELPLAGGSQASIVAGMMTANAYQQAANVSAGASLIGGLGSLLTGNIGGAISGAANAVSQYAHGQANYLSNMLSGKSTVQKSGSFGASHGAMGIKTPFITVTRPKQIQVPNYEDLYGYPAHKMVTIGACTGFLRCREVHVISATANDEEKNLIENLLKSGVYVTE